MIDALSQDLLPRIAQLMKSDEDFRAFVEYLTGQVTSLALKSTRHGGDQGEKLKGASIAMAELRDMLLGSPQAFQNIEEAREMNLLDRDSISP